MSKPEKLTNLQAMLAEAVSENPVPGASVAVLYKGEIYEAAAGVLNVVSGVSVTPQSLFHIGSISKLFTATQVMQLVAQGKVDIDKPFQAYVPEFTLNQKSVAAEITVRQLLSHTSGIMGDYFEDTGSGDDCLEKYAAGCAELDVVYKPGERFSYCNTGFNLLGRLIEKFDGQCWESSLEEMLLEPLGVKYGALRPEQKEKLETAVGHRHAAEGYELESLGSRSTGPSGSTLALSPRELLKFVQFHMAGGKNEIGTSLLPESLVEDMQCPQVSLAHSKRTEAWGLGWGLYNWGGKNVIGHDGGTACMASFLRIVPEENFAVALMSNSNSGGLIFRTVVGALLKELVGIEIPKLPTADPEATYNLANYTGRYRRYGMQIDVKYIEGDKLSAIVSSRDGEDNVGEPMSIDLTPVTREFFLVHLPGATHPMEISFEGFGENGKPEYLYSMERVLKRLDED